MSSLVKFPHHIYFEIYLLVLLFVIMISGHYNIILDYGATMYMFTKKVYFKLLKFEEPGHFVTIGGYNQVSIVG